MELLVRENMWLSARFNQRLHCLILFMNTATWSSETKGLGLESQFWRRFGKQYLQRWSKVEKCGTEWRDYCHWYKICSWEYPWQAEFISKEEQSVWTKGRGGDYKQARWCSWSPWTSFESATRFWRSQKIKPQQGTWKQCWLYQSQALLVYSFQILWNARIFFGLKMELMACADLVGGTTEQSCIFPDLIC